MLAIDIGSFPVSKRGNNCFLMMLDSNTKFMAVSAMKGQKADVVKSALWDKWYPYFGIPEELCSDQGKNVDGEVIRKLCEDLNIKKIRSSPFHPQGNGSAEKAVGTLKTIMRSMIQSRKLNLSDWDIILPEAILAANNMVNKSTQYSPFMMMWGTKPRMPVDSLLQIPTHEEERHDPSIIQKNADMNRQEAQVEYKKRYDKSAHPMTYEVGQESLLRRNYGNHVSANIRWLKGPSELDRDFVFSRDFSRDFSKIKSVFERKFEPKFHEPVNIFRKVLLQQCSTVLLNSKIISLSRRQTFIENSTFKSYVKCLCYVIKIL